MVLTGYVLYISFQIAFVSLLHGVKEVHPNTSTETEDDTDNIFLEWEQKRQYPQKAIKGVSVSSQGVKDASRSALKQH